MSWMNILYKTYENNMSKAGKAVENGKMLSLVSHMLANAQIEITINEHGDFRGARIVDKNERQTIIPVTESSAGRASGIAPHPLCDTLSYTAKDYCNYAESEKEIKKAEDKFNAYSKQLKDWVESEYSHPKIKAVYTYAEKGQTIHDLVSAGVVELDDDGKFSKNKIQGNTYEKCLVRYRVTSSDYSENSDAVWEDVTLFHSYIKYYLSHQKGEEDICYVTGSKATMCVNHPKGIVSANYGAKLISANDNAGFTFRGRFENSNEACTVSYEATQKAHNALTWLAANQGVTFGSQNKRTYVCWNPEGKQVPNLANPYVFEDVPVEGDTEPEFKRNLYKAFMGYENAIDDCDNIVIIALDAATTGRLSITYYNELKASDFFYRLKNWAESCKWYMPLFTPEKKPYTKIQTPHTMRIAEYAFGSEQGGFIKLKDEVLKEQSQRILHCMIDSQPVPRDIVQALVLKASNPLAYSSYWNRQKVLAYACALIYKYHNDKGEKITMVLDKTNTNRSYLFGRLLALAEVIGASVLEDGRETNAVRLWNAFSNHPMQTWRIIYEQLIPYMEKHKEYQRTYYKKQIDEIFNLFTKEDFSDNMNKALDDIYLCGYHNQRMDIYTKKTEDDNNIEEE